MPEDGEDKSGKARATTNVGDGRGRFEPRSQGGRLDDMSGQDPRSFAGSDVPGGEGLVQEDLCEVCQLSRSLRRSVEAELGERFGDRCFTCYHTV